jgi:DNA repair protein RadC
MEQRAWLPAERPRERLLLGGAETLTDAELMALIIGSGVKGADAVATCRRLLSSMGGLARLMDADPAELMTAPGIGRARACAIAAAAELARRSGSISAGLGDAIHGATDVYRRLVGRMGCLPEEAFVVIGLDSKSQLRLLRLVAQGSTISVEVTPAMVYRPLLRAGIARSIVAHNHPSGDPEPSAHDLELTARLVDAGSVLGIELLDHVIVAATRYVSLAERGLI